MNVFNQKEISYKFSLRYKKSIYFLQMPNTRDFDKIRFLTFRCYFLFKFVLRKEKPILWAK